MDFSLHETGHIFILPNKNIIYEYFWKSFFQSRARVKLFKAIRNNEAEVVESLLQKRPDFISLTNGNGKTLLHAAAAKGNVDILDIILKYHLEIDAKDNLGQTALHRAIRVNQISAVRLLLENGADPNCTDNKGLSSAFFTLNFDSETVIRSQTEILKLLIKYKTNLNHQDNTGRTVLHRAFYHVEHGVYDQFRNSFLEYIKCILENNIDPDIKHYSNFSSVVTGIAFDAVEIVEMLVKYGASLHLKQQDNFGLLHHAVVEDSIDCVKFLLSCNIDLNAKSDILEPDSDNQNATPLELAVYNIEAYNKNSTEIAEVLCLRAIQLKCLDIYISKENVNCLLQYKQDEYDTLVKKCLPEVEMMKKKYICENYSLTLYDILQKPLTRVLRYFKNRQIRLALKSHDFSKHFPIYSGMIDERIKWCTPKVKQLEKGEGVVNSIVEKAFRNEFLVIPPECTLEIYKYFNRREVIHLLNSFDCFE